MIFSSIKIRRYRLMRLRTMLFAATLVSCVAFGTSQPVSCTEDGECREGYFCDTSVYVCQECLSCESLKREPVPPPHACIKSITECGPCLKGLVEDRQVYLSCVLPSDGGAAASDTNTTAWLVAGITIALIFVVGVAVVLYKYLCKNSFIKFNVDTNIDATLPTHAVATAPEAPPPYSSPQHNKDPQQPEESAEDTSHPLIKKSDQPPCPAYEAQDYQNVSMFNPPAYVRLNGLQPKVYNDVNDNYPPGEHDEATTPSAWVPGHDRADADTSTNPTVNGTAAPRPQSQLESNESAGDFSTALAIARNTDLIQQPPVTLHTQTIGTNDEENIEDDGSPQPMRNGASSRSGRNNNYKVMNVNQIITIIKPPL